MKLNVAAVATSNGRQASADSRGGRGDRGKCARDALALWAAPLRHRPRQRTGMKPTITTWTNLVSYIHEQSRICISCYAHIQTSSNNIKLRPPPLRLAFLARQRLRPDGHLRRGTRQLPTGQRRDACLRLGLGLCLGLRLSLSLFLSLSLSPHSVDAYTVDTCNTLRCELYASVSVYSIHLLTQPRTVAAWRYQGDWHTRDASLARRGRRRAACPSPRLKL